MTAEMATWGPQRSTADECSLTLLCDASAASASAIGRFCGSRSHATVSSSLVWSVRRGSTTMLRRPCCASSQDRSPFPPATSIRCQHSQPLRRHTHKAPLRRCKAAVEQAQAAVGRTFPPATSSTAPL